MFLYTNNSQSEKETIQFTVASKRIKYLGINLNNQMKDSYTENYKILLAKRKKRRYKKWKDILCLWIERLNIVETFILPKMIY